MSTRSNIIVRDERESVQIYRHCDGYPTAVVPELEEVLNYAWELPRFEVSDFSAAIVAAWKQPAQEYPSLFGGKAHKNQGGNIYIDGVREGVDPLILHGDIEWLYVIYQEDDAVMVEIHERTYETNELTFALHDKGEIREMIAKWTKKRDEER